MSIHWKVEEAFDEIDAAVFSGDSFHDEENLKELERFIQRWSREAECVRQNNFYRSDEGDTE